MALSWFKDTATEHIGMMRGLAWALLHLIETAPDLSLVLAQADETSYWIRFIWERLARSTNAA